MINIKNIYKSYGDNTVLNNLSLEISEPGIYAILGKNGAGKTTLFRILSNLEKPDRGEIIFPNDAQTKIGYLATEQFYYPHILGEEYLQFCLHAQKLSPSDYDKYNVLFDLPLNKKVDTYSSGMKKKLGIMGVLLQESEILLLDEPYNGLDIESVMLVGKLIEKLVEHGNTILLSSHILSSITDITANIYYLKDGQLIDYSDKDIASLEGELLDGDKLKKLDDFFGNGGD